MVKNTRNADKILRPKSISIFYYPEENRFKTADGKVILNLYPLADPNRIYLFKHRKKSMTFMNYKYHIEVKLLYPINSEQ